MTGTNTSRAIIPSMKKGVTFSDEDNQDGQNNSFIYHI